eukprot:Gb_21660 [translate_table: standard]
MLTALPFICFWHVQICGGAIVAVQSCCCQVTRKIINKIFCLPNFILKACWPIDSFLNPVIFVYEIMFYAVLKHKHM